MEFTEEDLTSGCGIEMLSAIAYRMKIYCEITREQREITHFDIEELQVSKIILMHRRGID